MAFNASETSERSFSFFFFFLLPRRPVLPPGPHPDRFSNCPLSSFNEVPLPFLLEVGETFSSHQRLYQI